MPLSADEARQRRKTLLPLLWIGLVLYAALLVGLRGHLLLEPTMRIALHIAFWNFLFPLTNAELMILAALAITSAFYWRASHRREEVEPLHAPPTEIRSFRGLLSRENLGLGWSIVWRLYLVRSVFQWVPVYVPNAYRPAVQGTFLVASVLLAVYFFKQQIARRHVLMTREMAWAFLSQSAVVVVLGEAFLFAFALVIAVIRSKGQAVPPLFLEWLVALASLAWAQSMATGWVARRSIRWSGDASQQSPDESATRNSSDEPALDGEART